MTMLEIARKYVARGWSVIPLEGKIPSIVWKEYQARYPTDEELQRWFSDGKKNIGIVTGKISGLSVVDCVTFCYFLGYLVFPTFLPQTSNPSLCYSLLSSLLTCSSR